MALENLALRQQLALYKRRSPRLGLSRLDKIFLILLSSAWSQWAHALIVVKPETVIRWHRKGFGYYWRRISSRNPGRPAISKAIRDLIRKMAAANPLWGAPRIHAELLKLGIHISERTVSRLRPKRKKPPSCTWITFLDNHIKDFVSIDFFIVPTATFRVLFVLVILSHHRRQVIHFNFTEHPTALWTGQQIIHAFPYDTAPRYLIRDRDGVYGQQFRERVKSLGIEEILTAARSPWQNAYCERLIGSVRRKYLDHVIVLDDKHLRRILREYIDYYNNTRTHLSLNKDSPESRDVHSPEMGNIIAIPQVGGLHHRYERTGYKKRAA